MKNLILILFLFIGFNATAQLNLDSLNHVWLEETQPDSSRFKAIESIIWDGLLFKRPDTAFILLQEFKKFAQEKENKKWEARALGIMGVYFINQGNFSLALEHDLKSLKIYEEIGFKEGIGHSYNDIGVIYKNLGNPDKALEYFTQALEIRLDIGVMTNIPSSYNNIGVIHSIQGNNLEAIKFFKKGIDLAEEIGEDEEMINPLYNVADEYYIIGDTIKALEHMYQSLQISEKLNYKGGIASAFKFLGRVYFDQRNIPKAIEFATNSLNLAREIDYIWEIRHAAGLLKDIYEFQKLGLQALEMYELEIQMRDSLNSEDAKKGLIQMEVEHEYEKKELLAEQEHQQEIFKKNETRNYLIAGVSLALLFSIGILSRLRFVRRTNGALELAKNRAEKSEQFKQQFLANMSHEIRTPMHAISGMVKILKRKEHPTNQDTYLNAMHTSSDNLLVILNDVLDLSKIEVGKLDIESIPVKPAAIVENVMQILKFKAEEKGLILSANIEKDVPSLVMGD
ncbi:MAG: signal transduction histidine kinase, partial [Vicingaceae bacterium]